MGQQQKPLFGLSTAKVARMMNTDPAWGYSECALEMIYG